LTLCVLLNYSTMTKTMKMRLVPFGEYPPDWNMAADEFLFREFMEGRGLPSLRFYGFKPVSVTLGYHQKRVPGIFKKFPAVRRPTGGRAVLHNGDLVYSVVGDHTAGYFAGSIFETYRKIATFIVDALREHGFNARLSQGSTAGHTELCFDSTTRYEITLEGRKIVGAAQVRRKNAFLEQGSIQFFELDRRVLADAIRNEFSKAGIEFVLQPFSEEEIKRIEELTSLYPVIEPSG